MIAIWFLYCCKDNQVSISIQQAIILLSFVGSSYYAETV